jgi:ATP-dependent Lon protease
MCTANTLDTIPAPLLDRMEVIRLAGYITDEKMHISREYLEPQTRASTGIPDGASALTPAALHKLIEDYCREAGVRNLKKHLEKVALLTWIFILYSRVYPRSLQPSSYNIIQLTLQIHHQKL